METEKSTHAQRDGVKRIQTYLNSELCTQYTSLVLVTCFFVSGLIDSVAFNSWSCFVSMQTGEHYTKQKQENIAEILYQATLSSPP